MSADVSINLGANYYPVTDGAEPLLVALIGPDAERRSALTNALAEGGRASVREFHSYPAGSDDFQLLLEQSFDVILVELDSDPDVALELVESLRVSHAPAVMVYSEKADTKLAVSFMRAGALEYLVLPLERGILDEALSRSAAMVRPKPRAVENTLGKLLVFLGAKGGSGVTTVACNLAIALARGSEQSSLLIDLAAPIGDAALTLGISADYSTEDALQSAGRLDASLLERLVVKHKSGLFVLAAPGKVPVGEPSKYAIDKLIAVARRKFNHVIVDLGSRIDMAGTALFKDASTIYLVTLTGISDLRNSSRLISQFFTDGSPKLEVVINRFEPRLLGGVGEDAVTKALGRPARWKIPDDQDAVREMKNGETGQGKTRLSRLSLEMAGSITGHPVSQEKKKGFDFLSFGRSIAGKISHSDQAPSMAIVPSAKARTTPAITAVPSANTRPVPAQAIAPPSTQRPVSAHTIASPSTPRPAPAIAIVPPANARPAPAVVIAPPADGRSTPAVTWAAPGLITYGDPLTTAQLNATASEPGTFAYTPGPGYMLPAGTHTLSVTFTPAEIASYTMAQATVSLKVARATPIVTWSNPDPITYGASLGTAELCATASVPGNFDYSPAPGEVLAAGTHTLSVTFTPTDSANYATTQTTVSIDVARATPVVTWANPDPIPCGTPLSAMQLAATASVPGTFEYSPAPGEVLPPGIHRLSVTFTPADTTNYTTSQAGVSVKVAKAGPVITWTNPDPITYGELLSPAELCAMAPVAGTYEYSPALGKVLAAGTHPLSVVFTPDDSENYVPTQATVSLDVAKATPVIAWESSNPIPYGTQLSPTQLCATASVPGSFHYSPAPGEVLPPGTHTLSVTFTPTDSGNYASTQATVSLSVVRATPDIDWSNLDPIPYGTPLGSSQLCATAPVSGSFDYSPALDEVLSPGMHTLSVTFTPDDSSSYIPAQATASLFVARAKPVGVWSNPEPIPYGSPLSGEQLNASASVPGTFEYSPVLGTVLPVGTHPLSVVFTPDDSTSYAATQATVSLDVLRATPAIAWSNLDPIPYGTPLSTTQLCATASVPGAFTYSPAFGEVLPPGTHPLSVTFTPYDSENYATTQATVSLDVATAKPVVAWPNTDPKAAQPSASRTSTANQSPAAPDPEATSKGTTTMPGARETRVYKGAVYEKGEDGQWHLQRK